MKTVQVLLLFLFLVSSAKAQHNLFVKSGLNLSGNVPTDGVNSNSSHRVGFQVGVGDKITLMEKLNITTELLFVTKGYKSLTIPDSKNVFYYINLPVLAGLKVGKFHFELGPELGYMIGYDIWVNNVDGSRNRLEYDRFDVGLAGGLSFDLSQRFTLNGRYVLGLLATHKGVEIDSFSTFNIYSYQNRSIQLCLNYKIN